MRDTFAQVDEVQHRLKAATCLLGVTDTTLRAYGKQPGLEPIRASEINPKAPPNRIYTPELIFKITDWRRKNNLIRLPERKRPYVITVDLIKGGVGKSTTAVETAVNLQLLGFRTLLIDLDVQGNATQLMGYEPDLTDEERSIYGLSEKAIIKDSFTSVLLPYLDRLRRSPRPAPVDDIDPFKKPFGEYGPHLVPADTTLADAEQALAMSKGGREMVLRRMLNDSTEGKVPWFDVRKYDAIIIDCAPSTSLLTSAALAAADLVLAPVRLDAFALKGLSRLASEITVLREEFQVDPDLAILPTHYAANLSRTARMQGYLRAYEDHVLPSYISLSEDFAKTLEQYLPLTLVRPTSKSAAEYRAVAEQLKNRILEASKS